MLYSAPSTPPTCPRFAGGSEASSFRHPVSELISRFTSLPGYGIGGLLILLLYAVQSEI